MQNCMKIKYSKISVKIYIVHSETISNALNASRQYSQNNVSSVYSLHLEILKLTAGSQMLKIKYQFHRYICLHILKKNLQKRCFCIVTYHNSSSGTTTVVAQCIYKNRLVMHDWTGTVHYAVLVHSMWLNQQHLCHWQILKFVIWWKLLLYCITFRVKMAKALQSLYRHFKIFSQLLYVAI